MEVVRHFQVYLIYTLKSRSISFIEEYVTGAFSGGWEMEHSDKYCKISISSFHPLGLLDFAVTHAYVSHVLNQCIDLRKGIQES